MTEQERDELDSLLLQPPSTEDQTEELAHCAADPVYWVNTYCWTYDPRLLPADPNIPFRLFPRQEEFLRWLEEREQGQEDGMAEKSRDMGLTYLCCAYALHGWLFRPGFSAGFGSRKLELVDRIGDPDCIFEKLRIMIRRLPAWMMPAGFRADDHDNHCRLMNPATGATVTGEGGDNIGRGGRKTIYFVDEAAFLEHPQTVEAALSQTTRCRIWVSTPNGPGNPFATKRFSGKIPVFTFHWKDDPRKGEAWYAAEVARLQDPVTVAQEIDIDYTASVEGICIPAKWVRAAVGLELPESGSVVAGFDVAEFGPDRNVVIGRQGPRVGRPVEWGQANTTESAYRARDEAVKLDATCLLYDCVGVGAGVRGAYESAETPLPFQVKAVNSGESPTLTRWPDGKTAKERFLNLRAELWWTMRIRFEKAYEHSLWRGGQEGGKEHPAEEMISLPNHPGLIADLSLPRYFRTETGKTKLEAKADMRKRGVKSPNFADALALTFAPGKKEVAVF